MSRNEALCQKWQVRIRRECKRCRFQILPKKPSRMHTMKENLQRVHLMFSLIVKNNNKRFGFLIHDHVSYL